MKIINYEMLKALNLPVSVWYDWVDYVLKNKHTFWMPAKTCQHFGDSYYNTMPSILTSEGVMGVKSVNRFLNREPSVQGQLMLHNANNGEFLALMDASYITTMRTGAVAVHSIETFANKDFKTVGFMGFGNIGAATLDIFFDHYKEKKIHFKVLKYKDHAKKILVRYKKYNNVSFEVVDSVEKLICNSDVIISSITYTDDILGKDEWYKEGCTVIPVHLRGFQNCDLFFDKVFGDDRDQIKGFKYFDLFKFFAEESEYLRGEVKGRESENERIICYSVGLSLHDIYAAAQLFKYFKNDEQSEYGELGPVGRYWL